MASVLDSILNAVKTVIDGLDLTTTGGESIECVIKGRSEEETVLESLPVIVLSSRKPPHREPWAFGKQYRMEYPVTVDFVTAPNTDYNDDDIDTYAGWHQSITNAFKAPTLSGVTAVFDTNVTPGVLRDDRGKYGFGSLEITFTTVE